MKKVLAVFLVAVFLSSCGVNTVRIAEEANGPKELYVKLANDPLLISIDLRAVLEAKGYEVSLNTENTRRSAIVDEDGAKIIYHNVSGSTYRYQLSLGYQPIQDRIRMISAVVTDRESGKILGTYRWTWNTLLPAPTIVSAIDMIESNLLRPVFR